MAQAFLAIQQLGQALEVALRHASAREVLAPIVHDFDDGSAFGGNCRGRLAVKGRHIPALLPAELRHNWLCNRAPGHAGDGLPMVVRAVTSAALSHRSLDAFMEDEPVYPI